MDHDQSGPEGAAILFASISVDARADNNLNTLHFA